MQHGTYKLPVGLTMLTNSINEGKQSFMAKNIFNKKDFSYCRHCANICSVGVQLFSIYCNVCRMG